MSLRRDGKKSQDQEVEQLRKELSELKSQARSEDAADIAGAETHSHEFDKLTPIEQSAANLGVNPTSWKPIAFLNNAHYNQLIGANMLDETLARRIEAYRAMAANEPTAY